MSQDRNVYSFCFECSNIVRGDENHDKKCSKSKNSLGITHIQLIENLVSHEEEETVIQLADYAAWDLSVSGCKKQEYGPYIDFKEQSLDTVCYSGLPYYSRIIVERLRNMIDSFKDFRPFRQRNIEHTGEEWNDSKHYDHSWLFTDRMAILCFLSDVVIRVHLNNEVADALEINVPARSALILSEEYSRHKITFKKVYHSSRAVLMFYNEIKPSMLEACNGNAKLFDDISYFLDSFKGVTISNYVENQKTLIAEEAFPPPLFVNKIECENFNTDLIVELITQKYGFNITNAKLIDGYFDTNVDIDLENNDKVWGKVAVDSSLINEKSLNATLPFQRWISEVMKSPMILPTKENALYIWFDRTKRHFLWIMEYINGKNMSELPSLSIDTLTFIGSFLGEFHEISSQYPKVSEVEALSFLTAQTLTNDLTCIYQKLFIVENINRRKLLFTSLRLIEDYVKLYGGYCKSGIIHTMFNGDTLFVNNSGDMNDIHDLTIAHFANIRYGFYVIDLIFCVIRFLTSSIDRSLEIITAIITGYCKKREINVYERKLIYPLLMGLSCICYLDDVQSGLSKQIPEDEKKQLLDKVEERFVIVEYFYQDLEFQKKLEINLERVCGQK